MHSHHNHSHTTGQNHHHHPQSFNKAFAIAVTATLAFTFAEAAYGIMVHSMSLLADAAHNLGDSLGLILAWIANWLLTIPPGKRYSYGFKRTTIIAALANASILVATSALIAYECIFKLFNLTSIDENVVIIVGLVGIVVNGGSSLLFMRGAGSDLNIKSAFWHLFADMLLLVGVVISAFVIKFTGWLWVDPVVGLIIVAIVLWGTWGLMRDSVHLILDAVPHYIDHIGVKEYLTELPGVEAIHDLHIWGLSTREVALTAHLVMPEKQMSDADYKKVNHILHERFNINHVTLQVEKGSAEDPCIRSEAC